MSSQLAEHKKTLLCIFFIEILRERVQTVHDVVDYNAQTVATNLPKIKQNIMIALKNHHFDMIRSNRKLQFYSTFKTDQSIKVSLQFELIKNVFHRQSVAKLRSRNHELRIETGRHCVPKIPENLRICPNCSSIEVENEIHFLFYCNSYKCIRKTFFLMIQIFCNNIDVYGSANKLLLLLLLLYCIRFFFRKWACHASLC